MKILVKAQAGSHLFGTNTENSDMDYKGIYIPDKRDILLNKVQGSVSIKRDKEHGEKNTKDDVDVELYSFQKFMNMLYEGQTVALELLWTPADKIIEAHPAWFEIQKLLKEHCLHKKVTSFVGYCKTQADKYGVKGSRMAAVKLTYEYLISMFVKYGKDTKLELIWDKLEGQFNGVEHIEFGIQETRHGEIPFMEVCGRKYQDNQSIEYTVKALRQVYDSYGTRAKQAETNEGIDWKALSHAYRVCCQAIEILRDHKLTLPLKEEDLTIVRDVKLGKIPFKEFQPMLESKLEEVLKWEKESTLRENFDYTFFCEEVVIALYEGYISNNT